MINVTSSSLPPAVYLPSALLSDLLLPLEDAPLWAIDNLIVRVCDSLQAPQPRC